MWNWYVVPRHIWTLLPLKKWLCTLFFQRLGSCEVWCMPGTRTGLFPHWWYLEMELKSVKSFSCMHFSTRLMWKHLSWVLFYAHYLPNNKFSSVLLCVLFLFIMLFSEVFIAVVISHGSWLHQEQRSQRPEESSQAESLPPVSGTISNTSI